MEAGETALRPSVSSFRIDVMRKAIVRDSDGLVVNIALVDDGKRWSPPAGHTAIASDAAGKGWTYDFQTQTFDPPPTRSQPHVDLILKKWDGTDWVVEERSFYDGQKVRIEATIRMPDGTVAPITKRFLVPLFRGRQSAPDAEGNETVEVTGEQALILPMDFRDGEAVFHFVASGAGWLVAVPGHSSKWLRRQVARAVVAKSAL